MHRARWIRSGLLAAVLSWTGCEGSTPGELAAPPDPGAPPEGISAVKVADGCPSDLDKRTPEEVLADLRAAVAAGDMDAAMCNYDLDAVRISDGGVDVTHDEIRAALEFELALFGGTLPVVVQEIVVPAPAASSKTHLVRVLFTIDTSCVSVPDGVETYVIEKGLIQGQTWHGFPVFHC